jgi:hypothetical protein
MKKLLLGFGAFLIAASAFGSTGTGKITGLIPYFEGNEEFLFIRVENISSNTPACNSSGRYVIKSTNNPHFKYTQSAVLAAFMAGTPVIVNGKNTCDTYGNSETLWYMCLGTIQC